MGRVLCVDYGRTRVGVAVSDPLGTTAQPLEVIDRPKKGSLVERVAEVVRRIEPDEVVVGLPLRLDGTSGPAADATRQFADALSERIACPVVFWDERLSTVEASRTMRAAGVDARRQRGAVDKVAAAVVLRSYLEARASGAPDPDDVAYPEPVDAEATEPSPKRPRPPGRPERRVRRSREAWRQEGDDL